MAVVFPSLIGKRKGNEGMKGYIFIWVIVGTLVLLLTGGAFYLGRSTSPKPSPAPAITSQPPQPTPDASREPTGSAETANWKTYTNTKYGYSLQYPTDKFVQLVCPKDEKEYFYLVEKDHSTQDRAVINMPSCARDSRYLLEIRTITTNIDAPISNEYVTVSVDNIMVDDVNAGKYTSVKTSAPSPYPEWYTQIILLRNGATYDIYFDKKPLEKTFDQILSTFKFF